MKRTIGMILAVVLCLGMFPVMAGADYTQAQYSSTRSFLRTLDDNGITYTYEGIRSDVDDQEQVTISLSNDNWGSFKFSVFFDSNCENAYFYVWNLLDYNENMYLSVCQALDSLNAKYRITTFCTDTSDNSVTVKYTSIFRGNDVGEINYEALARMVDIIGKSYDTLKIFIA